MTISTTSAASTPRTRGMQIGAWDRTGEGEAIVLLHGTGGGRSIWDPIRHRLAEHREVLAPDLPGCGDSPDIHPGTRATIAAFCDATEDWLDDLGVGTCCAVGNSLGGQMALELAARGRATSVVALSPTGFWTGKESLYTRTLVGFLRANAKMSGPLVPVLSRSAIGRTVLLGTSVGRPAAVTPTGAVEIVRSLASSSGVGAVNRDANRERVGGIRTSPRSDGDAARFREFGQRLRGVPITIAWAEKDRFLPVRQAARARQVLPEASHVILDGCGHLATWDDPQRIASLILSNSALGATRVAS